jgi:hypothetical protein
VTHQFEHEFKTKKERTRANAMILASIGYLFILAGVIQLGRDILMSIQRRGFALETLGEFWAETHIGSLNLFQVVIERYIWPPLWDPLVVSALQLPVWLLLFAIAFICLAFSQRQI